MPSDAPVTTATFEVNLFIADAPCCMPSGGIPALFHGAAVSVQFSASQRIPLATTFACTLHRRSVEGTITWCVTGGTTPRATTAAICLQVGRGICSEFDTAANATDAKSAMSRNAGALPSASSAMRRGPLTPAGGRYARPGPAA
ncbi:MAG: hypothetical protein H7A18_14075 [Sinobacteraceae bacterium]|nr:hypothetical protein [Nevskiaceae bacterium]MCP5467081.1 hypothetical protein [Nevskiaceae bacterium]MCP5473179.1 hypothetical protein [Nevskiaceae bacterium]